VQFDIIKDLELVATEFYEGNDGITTDVEKYPDVKEIG
jgi:hypothetical protein